MKFLTFECLCKVSNESLNRQFASIDAYSRWNLGIEFANGLAKLFRKFEK